MMHHIGTRTVPTYAKDPTMHGGKKEINNLNDVARNYENVDLEFRQRGKFFIFKN